MAYKLITINADLCRMLGLDRSKVTGFNLRVRAGEIPILVVRQLVGDIGDLELKRYALVEIKQDQSAQTPPSLSMQTEDQK